MENKRKDVEEKEKSLAELDRQLKKRKEQMDQMEASLRKVGEYDCYLYRYFIL